MDIFEGIVGSPLRGMDEAFELLLPLVEAFKKEPIRSTLAATTSRLILRKTVRSIVLTRSGRISTLWAASVASVASVALVASGMAGKMKVP